MATNSTARTFGWVPVIALCASQSAAQETMTFEVRVSDQVLEPGEAQTIEVWVTFAPTYPSFVPWNTNGGTGQPGQVMGFGGAVFELQNVLNGQSGSFQQLTINPGVFWLFSESGTPTAQGSVVGIAAYQPVFPSPQFASQSPIHLWSATWVPSNYEHRQVAFAVSTVTGPDAYLQTGLAYFVPDTWTPITPSTSFLVVPSPAPTCAAWLVMLVCIQRRRR